MVNLTNNELSVINHVTQKLDATVNLGTILSEAISQLADNGTPTNSVEASSELTLMGVVSDSETFTINNPAVAGTNVYEFLSDTAQSKTSPTNIGINITANTVKATGTLTLAAQPTSGDTMTIGTKVYTFVPRGTDTADGEVSIGTDLASAKLALVAAINGTDGVSDPHSSVSAAAFVSDDCVITALVGGTVGNAIATTETFTSNSNIFGGVTLSGGSNCSAANAVTAIIAAVNSNDTQNVAASAGTGTVVVFTADVAGAAGNSIAVSESMANGAFGGSTLSGGANGTPAKKGKILADSSYLYICLADNTTSGKNWKRISLSTF